MIKTILIDMDGVLRSGNEILPGCKEFLTFVQKQDYACCIISNTTRYTSESIKAFFASHQIDISNIAVITALDATVNYVLQNHQNAAVYCLSEAKKAFGELHQKNSNEAVVIGDLGDQWSYTLLNEIFRKVQSGACLIAMQKNKFWKTSDGKLALDAGPFVEAIEYATDRKAILLGKPSSNFFNAALEACQGDKNNFIMLGDDLINDIEAAEKLGAKGILTLTGKTDSDQLSTSTYKPSHIVNNLKEVIVLLNEGLEG